MFSIMTKVNLLLDIHRFCNKGIETMKLVVIVFFLIEPIRITAYNIYIYFSKFHSFYDDRLQEVSFTSSVAEVQLTWNFHLKTLVIGANETSILIKCKSYLDEFCGYLLITNNTKRC